MIPRNFVDVPGSSRRGFLKNTGALIVGFSLAGGNRRMAAQNPIDPTGLVDAAQVDSWISIAEDESITVYSGKIEFGQGFSTVQTQLVAEELFVPLSRVKVIFGDTGFTPDQGVTSGSQSTRTEFSAGGLRQALDTARDALFQLASQQLDAVASQLTVGAGVFSVKGGDPSNQVSYGQLLQGKRFNLTLSGTAVPKDPRITPSLERRCPSLIFHPRLLDSFSTFSTYACRDAPRKGCPAAASGAKVLSVDKSPVAGMPSNIQVIVKNDFVGVVADTE